MFIFPAHKFNPAVVSASIVGRVISGGESINGVEDTIATDGGGRWQIGYSGIELYNNSLIKAWEAWDAYLDGGAVDVLVPVLSVARANRPIVSKQPLKLGDLVLDDDLFPTSASYSGNYISAVAQVGGALRATELTINVLSGAPLEGGETFSIAGRTYRVSRVKSRPTDQSAVVDIRPPLRDVIANGAVIDFNYPLVKCRLAPSQDITAEISFNRSASTAITFVENTL